VTPTARLPTGPSLSLVAVPFAPSASSSMPAVSPLHPTGTLHAVPAGRALLAVLVDARFFDHAPPLVTRIAVASATSLPPLVLIISAAVWELEALLRSIPPAAAGGMLDSFTVNLVHALDDARAEPSTHCDCIVIPLFIHHMRPVGGRGVALLAMREAGPPAGILSLGLCRAAGAPHTTCTASSRAAWVVRAPSTTPRCSMARRPSRTDGLRPQDGMGPRRPPPAARMTGTRLPALPRCVPTTSDASAGAGTRKMRMRRSGGTRRRLRPGAMEDRRMRRPGKTEVGRLSRILLPTTPPEEKRHLQPRRSASRNGSEGDVVGAAEPTLVTTFATASTTPPNGSMQGS
jgi:hypothetical protein